MVEVLELFQQCHHFTSSGMGGLNINLFHLPHPGGIQQQGYKLLKCFDIIKESIYAKHREEVKRG